MLAATDAHWFAQCGAPIAIIGMKAGNAHVIDESIELSSIDQMKEFLTKFPLQTTTDQQ
jgi:acetylornithine deacetylase/succinyl-diaminopimelate desuccinylase-like protein